VAQIDPLDSAGTAAPPLVAARQAEAVPGETAPGEPVLGETVLADGEAPVDVMDRLYRPQALDVPVLTSRDGPIAAIDPRDTGVLAEAGETAAVNAALAEALGTDVQVIAAAQEGVEVLAVRPSWVRVNAADGTVLFEKILDAGERYLVPQLEASAVFRTGNSGSIYFLINGVAHGPVAPGANVVKDIPLAPEALALAYAPADCMADDALSQVASQVTDLNTVPLCP
jgi:Domain of unknown function (DUF4115)